MTKDHRIICSLGATCRCGSLHDGQEMAEREGAGNTTDLCESMKWLNRKRMFPVSLGRRRRALALSLPESGHSPRRVDSGPPNLYVAPAHVISSLNTQQAIAEGEQLSWLSEKRLLSQRLECLQRAVARLEHEKTELKQLNAELRRTLEEVKQALVASAKPHGPLEHNTFPQAALWSPLFVSFPLPLSPVDTHFCILSLFWHPAAFTNAHSPRYHPSCPSVPVHTRLTLLCQELFPLALSLP